jgi:hypothetical protein
MRTPVQPYTQKSDNGGYRRYQWSQQAEAQEGAEDQANGQRSFDNENQRGCQGTAEEQQRTARHSGRECRE